MQIIILVLLVIIRVSWVKFTNWATHSVGQSHKQALPAPHMCLAHSYRRVLQAQPPARGLGPPRSHARSLRLPTNPPIISLSSLPILLFQFRLSKSTSAHPDFWLQAESGSAANTCLFWQDLVILQGNFSPCPSSLIKNLKLLFFVV